MSSINPFAGYVAQGSQVERAQASEKTRQVRREQALSKNVAVRDDDWQILERDGLHGVCSFVSRCGQLSSAAMRRAAWRAPSVSTGR